MKARQNETRRLAYNSKADGSLYDNLKQTTKDYIQLIYDKFMAPRPQGEQDSYATIILALRCLGVGPFHDACPEDLLASWVGERNKFVLGVYEDKEDDLEDLKRQAMNRYWGFDELKAIAARWIARKNEDEVLKTGRAWMKCWDKQEARLRERATKHSQVTEMQGEPASDTGEAEDVIRDDLQQHSDGNKPLSSHDSETLRLIKSLGAIQTAFAQTTAQLMTHLVGVQDFRSCPRIPLDRRLEAPQPISYPWRVNRQRPS